MTNREKHDRMANAIRFLSMDAVEQAFGAPVGVLVNNAVWARFGSLAEIDEEMAERSLAVGLKALLWTLQAAVPQMRLRGGGSVVNLSSTSALRPVDHAIVYAAMKAGVLGLTRAAVKSAQTRAYARLRARMRATLAAPRCTSVAARRASPPCAPVSSVRPSVALTSR
mgnify:CR=1 FL=1